MNALKVFLADADESIRISLERELAQERNLELVGSAGDALEVLKLLPSTEPDIVIMDLLVSGIDGLELIRRINQLEGKRPLILV